MLLLYSFSENNNIFNDEVILKKKNLKFKSLIKVKRTDVMLRDTLKRAKLKKLKTTFNKIIKSAKQKKIIKKLITVFKKINAKMKEIFKNHEFNIMLYKLFKRKKKK